MCIKEKNVDVVLNVIKNGRLNISVKYIVVISANNYIQVRKMIDREDLLEHVSEQYDIPKSQFIWSEVCVNPTEGYTLDEEKGTMVPNSLGYWIIKQKGL